MKSVIIISILLLAFNNAYGQWYVKKYHVPDLNHLSMEQLDESLENSKKNLVASGIITGMGAGICLVSRYARWEPDENPTLFEQLMGEKWKNTSAMIIGAGLVAGGVTGSVINFARYEEIRSVIHKNFPSHCSLNISPEIFAGSNPKTLHCGLSFIYRF